MRNAFAFVLQAQDPFSSFVWFDGWDPSARPSDDVVAACGPPIVAKPSTWLATVGWRTQGLLLPNESPVADPGADPEP